MPLQGYKVLAKDGLRGPFLKTSIIKGIALGKVPLDARLLDIETGKYVPAWTLIASSLEEARRAGGTETPVTPQSLEQQYNEMRPVESGAVAPVSAAPVQLTRSAEPASHGISSRVVLAVAAVCVCILLAGMFIGAAILFSGGSPDGASEQRQSAAHPDNPRQKSAPKETTNEPSPEEAARLAKELDQQRAEIEALKKQLAAQAALEQPESQPGAGSESITPRQEVAPSFAELVERYNPSVFLIYVEMTYWSRDGKKQVLTGTGSGWLAERNLIVTNKHVLFNILFDAERCRALEWLIREAGWRFNPRELLIAAFPTGSVIRGLAEGDADVLRDAWVYDGLNRGFKSRGTLSISALLPDVLTEAAATSALGESLVQIHDMGCNDLALLRMDGGGADALVPLPVAEANQLGSLRQMEELMSIGFPRGLNVAKGEKLQTSPALGHLRHYEAENSIIVTSASVHPGNSGGPMVRSDGKVVGVVSSGFDSDLNHAIDVNRVRTLLSSGGSVVGEEYLRSMARRFESSPSAARTGGATSPASGAKPSTAPAAEKGASDWLQSPESKLVAGWLAIREGQSQAKVIDLIGEALESGADSISIIWRYPDKNGAKVYFSPSTKLVRRWVTPWSRLQQWDSKNRVKQLLGEPSVTWDYNEPGEPRFNYWIYRVGTEIYWVAFDHQGELAGWKMPKE